MKKLQLRTKLLIAMLVVGLLPLSIAGIIVLQKTNSAIKARAFNQLESLRSNKADQVEEYFAEIENQILTFSNNIMVRDAMNELAYAFTHEATSHSSPQQLEQYKNKIHTFYEKEFAGQYKLNNGRATDYTAVLPADEKTLYHQYQYIANSSYPLGQKDRLDKTDSTGLYSHAHEKYHSIIRDYQQKFGYYDIFLVEPENGHIVYSVFKEIDFATSLEDGPYSQSNIAKVYQAAKTAAKSDAVFLHDFEPYLPSYNAPASFIASPIFENGRMLGVLIFQMPVDRLNSVMSNADGLGETGQFYLLGPDLLMRNQSRITDKPTLLTQRVESEGANKASMGEVGISIFTGYNGDSVLSAYSPLAINGLEWSIMAEMNEKEAFSAISEISMLLWQVAIAIILAVIAISYYMIRSVAKQLGSDPSDLLKVSDDIINGRLDREKSAQDEDTIGVYGAMLKMQDTLKESIEREASKNQRTERLKQALDNVSASIIVADADYNIIYTNNTADKYFSEIENDIKSEVPSFDAKNLVGTNIDSFHKDPSHQRQMLDNLQATFSSDLELGGHVMRLNVSPIISDNKRLGTVLEWDDLTAEKSIERQVQALVDASLEGDLSQRLDLSNKQGFLLRLSEGINNMVEVSESMINDTIHVLNAVSRGDLNEKIEAEYKGTFNQLKTDVNNTIDKLTSIMGSIKESSSLVNSAADEISRGNMDLSQRTESQAASLEETSSSMEEMTSSVKQNADNSKHANDLAIGAREQAQKSGEVVSEAVAAMEEINQASNKIAEITGVIDEIAFQTNLLALNAAVEAARAGEQGRGFAVVASEVRNLAGRSATAAKEIKDLIEDSVAKVEQGSRLVNQSGQTLEQIIGSIKQVTEIVGDISYATNEQASGIEQVNRAIINMDESTQNNAALVEQAAAAAESMNEQSNELMKQVSFFSFDQSQMDEALLVNASNEPPKKTDLSQDYKLQKVVGEDFSDDEWDEF